MATTDNVQLNARIGKKHKRNIKMDAARTNIAIDTITEAIVARFFRDVPSAKQREAIYQAHAAGLPA